jgi:hypothetical protein
MSGEGVEISIEAIAGEERHAAGSQLLAQAMDEQMSHAMGARTQQQHGNAFGERIDGHRLTAKPLDSLGFAVAPIAHDGLDIRIADPVVLAGLIGTGEALSLHPFGRSSSAFHLTPRTYWDRFSCPR